MGAAWQLLPAPWQLLAAGKLEGFLCAGLVPGSIEADFCKQIVNTHLKALAEIYTTHFFANLSNLFFSPIFSPCTFDLPSTYLAATL